MKLWKKLETQMFSIFKHLRLSNGALLLKPWAGPQN